MTKAPTPTEKSKKERDNTKNAIKNFDYTTIADRHRTVSWSKNSQHSGEMHIIYVLRSVNLLGWQVACVLMMLSVTSYFS